MIETKIKFPAKKKALRIYFNINELKKNLDTNPVGFDEIEQAELKDMVYQSFELDKDHFAYVFIPLSYFPTQNEHPKTKKSQRGKKKIEQLENIVKIQSDRGNWDFDPYMHGMANGLILALAIIKGETPEYKKTPEKWIKNKKD